MIRRTVALVVLVAACSGGDGVSTTSTTEPPPTAAATTAPVGIQGFPTGEVGVGDEAWLVAVADDHERRGRGLMGITDLGDVDAMLFVFPGDTIGRFWMKDTLIPLDIAFFDARGEQVGEVLTMTPCEADPCPQYGPGEPYRYALETEVGGFEGVELRLHTLDP